MKIRQLGTKVSLIVTLMIVAIIGLTIWIVMVQTDNLVAEFASNEAEAANISLSETLSSMQGEAQERAKLIARAPDVINAVTNQDQAALIRALNNYRSGMDDITVCDTAGTVIMRVQSDLKGDNIMSQKDVSTALSTGLGVSSIESEDSGGIFTCGSAAIITFEGKTLGAVVCGHDLSVAGYVDDIKSRTNCDVTIFDGDTALSTTLVDENGDRAVGMKAGGDIVATVVNQNQIYETRTKLFGNNYFSYYSPLVADGQTIGILYTAANIDTAMATRVTIITSVLLAIIVCGAVCVILIFVFSNYAISRPLRKIGLFAKKIQMGALGLSTPEDASIDVHSSDEVGVMARVLETAYAELKGYIEEIRARMQGLAEGDFVTQSHYDFQGDFIFIKDSINNIVNNLNQTLQEVNEASIQVAASATQVSDGAQMLAQGASEQASTTEELSAAIAEIREKTDRNASVAKEANDLSRAIRDNAEMGSAQMDNMVRAIREINEASSQISNVIKVIDNIAFQTNILALNAAVEAARAGQHGKGFAVVADEVRDLANRSAIAAKDSGRLIENSVEKANLGLDIATETAKSFEKIVEGVGHSAELVDMIAEASEEQAGAIANINAGIDQVTKVVQQNSMTAERSAAASEEMNGQSALLQRMISYFKVDSQK